MHCTNGYRQETLSMRRCVYRKQLDLAAAAIDTRIFLCLTLQAADVTKLPGVHGGKNEGLLVE